MITVGYGDIIPTTDNERLVCMLAIFIASGLFAYTMNKIGTALSRFERTKLIYRENIEPINRYMERKEVEKAM